MGVRFFYPNGTVHIGVIVDGMPQPYEMFDSEEVDTILREMRRFESRQIEQAKVSRAIRFVFKHSKGGKE